LTVYLPTLRLPVFVGPAVVAVAILGFVVGHHRLASSVGEPARLAYGTNVVLEYPSSWRQDAAGASIPGLPLAKSMVLAPGGDSSHAGLISGQLLGGEPGPLPSGTLSLMHELPRTEIVDFLDVQAYRYSSLQLPSYDRKLELYVIPNPTGASTALACYASQGYASSLGECEQIVSTLTVTGSARYDLNPDGAYSTRLARLVGALDAQRLALRRQMVPGASPAALASSAGSIADRFASAAASIRTLEAPSVAGPTQAALVGAIERARASYGGLASAAASGAPEAVAAAQQRVDEAEGAVDLALETYALLGYRHR
jgi:hypothetical protein